MNINENKDIEYLALKALNEDKIHISFSEFTKFQSCGHKHLLEKYLNIAIEPPTIHLIFGNSIHKAIENGIKSSCDVNERVKIFREDFTKEMMDKMNTHPDFRDMENFREQGENIIRYLSTEKLIQKYEIIGVELALYEPLYGPFHFKGFIDLVVRDRKTGRYVIIDWKTSSQEWVVPKKKKDKIFLAQMRFYKYFYSKKANIPMEEIDCRYVVLNRLVDKNAPQMGFGKLQKVDIYSSVEDIEESLKLLAQSVKQIHIENTFEKAKLIVGKKGNCFFCPHKNNIGLCNSDPTQYKQILKESRQSKLS